MTGGYDPIDPAVRQPPAPPTDQSGEYGARPGPHPPRMHATGQFPAQPASQFPGQPTGQFPTAPGAPYGPGPGSPVVPASGPGGPVPVSGPTGYGPPTSGFPAMAPVGAPQPVPPSPRRGGRLGAVAFVLVLLLLVVAGVQAYLLANLGHRLDAAQRDAKAARAEADSRLRGVESRTGALEKKGIDLQAVAKDVLPSVFRVDTGKAIGTAFAIGKAGGGTDLVTNNHVVDDLYKSGGREVSLEHNDQRFSAKIVKVDPGHDVALLHSDENFPPLVAAAAAAQPGQPIVVVGAPFGLESTVTSGVVSALRSTPDGPLVQFDAPINPGNSGGPVVNAQRQVIGIATLGTKDAAGINFAIPISVACQSLGVC
jgi:putative serine protease PepD